MSHDYQVCSRVQRYGNRVFNLVGDEVLMPGGRVVLRDYLRHVGAVGIVALDDDDRIIFVHQYRHAVGHHLWELPAGLTDVEGETLVEAASRELAEEVDLTAKQWDLLGDVHVSPGCSSEIIRIYLARQLEPVSEGSRHRRVDEESDMTIHRIPLTEAVSMVVSGQVTNAVCVVGVLATAYASACGWTTLRSVDEPLGGTVVPPGLAV